MNRFQYLFRMKIIPYLNIEYYIGIDSISLYLILLTTFLTFICILASWSSISSQIKEYMILFLLLETLMLNVFCVLDIVLFYIFFESVLIPMFLIIGIWGARERKIYAALQFFLYTLTGSLFMLLAIIVIYIETGTTDYLVILTYDLSPRLQYLLWIAFFTSFAVKIPIVPVHTWLPEAHVEAPTAGSVILAAILLKLGAYGIIRFSLALFETATIYYMPMVYTISIISIIYASLTTLRQIDLKKMIAYSSVAHMGFVTLGLFSLTVEGFTGAYIIMISHGLVSGALFLCVGILYDRHHTRILRYYSGLVRTMPVFIVIFLNITLANIALPGTSSFVGELLVLIGSYYTNTIITFFGFWGTVLSAAYGIWLFNRVSYTNINVNYILPYSDLNKRELFLFLPIIFFIYGLGIASGFFISSIEIPILHIIRSYEQILYF